MLKEGPIFVTAWAIIDHSTSVQRVGEMMRKRGQI